MEKKVYTHFSLHFYKKLIFLITIMVVLVALITAYRYFFDTVQLKDYYFFIGYTAINILLYSYQLLNVVIISDQGIKTYGLLYKEKCFTWNEIQKAGLAVNKHGVVSEIDSIKNKKKGEPSIYLSLNKPDKVNYSFLFHSPETIHFPYRQDVYNLVLEKLSLANN